MDPFIDAAIAHIGKELAVIAGAPVMFLFLAALMFVGAYFLLGLLHESRHAAHEGTVENKDARIELLEGQIEDYKGKLSGASPDQAAAKMEALAGNLQTAMSAVADLTRWKEYETFERHLSSEQKLALGEALRAIPIEARAFVFIAGVPEREPHQYAIELLTAFRAEGFCSTQFMPRPMASTARDERGVLVVVRDEAHPSPRKAGAQR